MSVSIQEVLEISHGPVAYGNASGLYPEILDTGHIRLAMPAGKMHVGEEGNVYEGSQFVLLEVAGGCVLAHSLSPDKYCQIAAVVKSVDVEYLRPCKGDIYVDATMTPEEVDALWEKLSANGLRGDFIVNLEVTDAEGTATKAKMNYFAIPFTKDFMAKK